MSGVGSGAASKTPDSKKDFWNTPWHAVQDAEFLIGQVFALDACATSFNEAKAEQWITPEQDALITEWLPAKRGAVWCNPPFSQKIAFIKRAYHQSRRHAVTVCVMLPFEPTTKWWRENISSRASVVYVPDGRYSYVDDETKIEQRGVNFSSCFVVFTPLTMPTQYIEFTRGLAERIMAANDNGDQQVVAVKL